MDGAHYGRVSPAMDAAARPAPHEIGRVLERQRSIARGALVGGPLRYTANQLIQSPPGFAHTIAYTPSGTPAGPCKKTGCGETLLLLAGSADSILAKGRHSFMQGADAKHAVLSKTAVKRLGDFALVPFVTLIRREHDKWLGVEPAFSAQLIGMAIVQCEHEAVWSNVLNSLRDALPCTDTSCRHEWVIQKLDDGRIKCHRACTGLRIRADVHIADMHKAQWSSVIRTEAGRFIVCLFHNVSAGLKFSCLKLGMRSNPDHLAVVLTTIKLFFRSRSKHEAEAVVDAIEGAVGSLLQKGALYVKYLRDRRLSQFESFTEALTFELDEPLPKTANPAESMIGRIKNKFYGRFATVQELVHALLGDAESSEPSGVLHETEVQSLKVLESPPCLEAASKCAWYAALAILTQEHVLPVSD